MIIAALIFLIILVGVFEFFIFHQRSQYKKTLSSVEALNLKLEILKSCSYILQSKQTLKEDWNQLLASQTNQIANAELPIDSQKNFVSSIENIAKMLIKKQELNKKVTPEQQIEAVSVKW